MLAATADLAFAAGIAVASIVVSVGTATLVAIRIARGRGGAEALERAQRSLTGLIEQEAESRTAELRALHARMRADSVSLLAEQERLIAEERREAVTERERLAGEELAERLSAVERRVDERLRAWSDDLDRVQQVLEAQIGRLKQRQAQLINEAEARIEAEAQELVATSDEQRASVLRLREDLERSAQAAVADALDELEAHTGERRRVIEEISERLRRREETLAEQIERGEQEATRRIQVAFADVERRQVEALERAMTREGQRYAEAAALQFDGAVKAAREEAASRLGRELDRAVESFARQADLVLADRMSHAAEAGAQRLEERLRHAQASFERQQEELVASMRARIAEADEELRRRVGAVVADAGAERR